MSNYATCYSCGEAADTDSVVCTECDRKFDAKTKERTAELEAELAASRSALIVEKQARIKYQEIVYEVCVALDRALGHSATRAEGTTATRDDVLACFAQVVERWKDAKAALAGLDPADVATLVGLVRRYRLYHDGQARIDSDENVDTCECTICHDARPLIARLP